MPGQGQKAAVPSRVFVVVSVHQFSSCSRRSSCVYCANRSLYCFSGTVSPCTGPALVVVFMALSVRKAGDIAEIDAAVEAALAGIGHKVNAIVNYDRFSIAPELVDDYIAMVKALMARRYHDVTRYTSSTFLRVKLGEALAKQEIAPKIFDSIDAAAGNLQDN